jgi:hypothetical protein
MARNQLQSLKGQSYSGNPSSNSTPSLFTGRVFDIILDDSHPFFTNKLSGFDPSYIGCIFWGSLSLKEGKKDLDPLTLNIAKPYFNSFTYFPIKNEIVSLILAPNKNHYEQTQGFTTNSEYYYFPPINVWNSSGYNPLPLDSDTKAKGKKVNQYINSINNNNTQQEENQIELGNYINEDQVATTKNMVPFEGDFILEGRFGNSIRFGSSNPRGKNAWSENDSEGEPITIISNGQTNNGEVITEDINGDASSIYLTSNQNLSNINISANNFSSLNAPFNPQQSTNDTLLSYGFGELPGQGIGYNTGNTTLGTQGDDDSVARGTLSSTPEPYNGPEELVKYPGLYEDNSRSNREVYALPSRFAEGGGFRFVTDLLVTPLMEMLLAAEADGVRLIVNSGFRPPVNNVKDAEGKIVGTSQKDLRLRNLKSKFKNKLAEPWLSKTTVISPFNHNGTSYNIGDTYRLRPQKEHFSPLTAPSYASGHGASTAVDFYTRGDRYNWLCFNGWKYGFIRTVASEAWHFKYSPSQAKNGPTSVLPYTYGSGKNSWKDVFGPNEPNWSNLA